MDRMEKTDKLFEITVMIDYAHAVLGETVSNYFEQQDPPPWRLATTYNQVTLLLGVASRYLFDAKTQADALLAEESQLKTEP